MYVKQKRNKENTYIFTPGLLKSFQKTRMSEMSCWCDGYKDFYLLTTTNFLFTQGDKKPEMKS